MQTNPNGKHSRRRFLSFAAAAGAAGLTVPWAPKRRLWADSPRGNEGFREEFEVEISSDGSEWSDEPMNDYANIRMNVTRSNAGMYVMALGDVAVMDLGYESGRTGYFEELEDNVEPLDFDEYTGLEEYSDHPKIRLPEDIVNDYRDMCTLAPGWLRAARVGEPIMTDVNGPSAGYLRLFRANYLHWAQVTHDVWTRACFDRENNPELINPGAVTEIWLYRKFAAKGHEYAADEETFFCSDEFKSIVTNWTVTARLQVFGVQDAALDPDLAGDESDYEALPPPPPGSGGSGHHINLGNTLLVSYDPSHTPGGGRVRSFGQTHPLNGMSVILDEVPVGGNWDINVSKWIPGDEYRLRIPGLTFETTPTWHAPGVVRVSLAGSNFNVGNLPKVVAVKEPGGGWESHPDGPRCRII